MNDTLKIKIKQSFPCRNPLPNGVVFTKDAVLQAVKQCKNIPITLIDGRCVGFTTGGFCAEMNNGTGDIEITFDGVLFEGYTVIGSESLNEDSEIASFDIRSIGISSRQQNDL